MPIGIYKRTEKHNLHNSQSKLGKRLGFKHSENTKLKMKKSRSKQIPPMLGKNHSVETRLKMSNSKKGSKSYLWKGGLTEKNREIRQSIEYRLWRESVFARDNWTCQKYGIKGLRINPHHIQNFSQFPELRFAIDNGITLSEKAHREFHIKYGKKNNTKEQIIEFLNSN